MPNPSPHLARLAKKRRRKPGTVADLQWTLWRALLAAEALVNEAETPDLAFRGMHCISQLSNQYLKTLEIGELEARLSTLEQTLHARRPA